MILEINPLEIISLHVLLERGGLGRGKHLRLVLVPFFELFTNPTGDLIDFVQYRTALKKEFPGLVIIRQRLFKPFLSEIGRCQIEVKVGRDESPLLTCILLVVFKIPFDERLQFLQYLTDHRIFLIEQRQMARLYKMGERKDMLCIVKLIILHAALFTNLSESIDAALKPRLVGLAVFHPARRDSRFRPSVIDYQLVFRNRIAVQLV